jgi:hypothetical protein
MALNKRHSTEISIIYGNFNYLWGRTGYLIAPEWQAPPGTRVARGMVAN